MTVEITDGSARLVLELLARSHPSDDYWDGNWVAVRLRAEVPGFRANFGDELHLGELEALRRDLARLYTDLAGAARLEVMEGFLDLAAEVDTLGHVHWSVEIAHPVGAGQEARLRFTLDADQSYLPGLLGQIEAALEEFPIAGHP